MKPAAQRYSYMQDAEWRPWCRGAVQDQKFLIIAPFIQETSQLPELRDEVFQ